MKIAFDHTIFLIQKYGGISRYFGELVNNLDNNYQAKIFCPVHLNKMISQNQKIFYLKEINSIPNFSSKFINYFNFFLNDLIFWKWKPDIIHKTYFNSYKYKYLKAKKVINVWDLSHEIFHEMYKKNKDWRPKKRALENIDHVICSSKNTQKELIQYYNFDYKKTSVVYQCVPNLKINTPIKEKKENLLLYVGSRLKYKNFKNLLKALSLNKNILEDFKLICFGDELLTNEEKFLIEEFKLNKKNIIFDGGDDYKLANYYTNATALIYPSQNEGFGFPPLEAMSYGCPIICSNNKAILEATDLIDYSFDPNDPKDIIKKIEKVIYSQEEINFLNNYGLKRVKIFNKKEMMQNIKHIYDNLV